MKKATIV